MYTGFVEPFVVLARLFDHDARAVEVAVVVPHAVEHGLRDVVRFGVTGRCRVVSRVLM
jgi:hypothetical protein